MAPKKAPDDAPEEEEKPITWEDNLGAAEVLENLTTLPSPQPVS